SVDGKNMAARTTTDNAINERRLRPIYDCLDNGNNKKALQEAVKLLKKQDNLLCAKVLKGLALIRLGRQNESIGILQEVHAEHPADETTLQAMTICYWELHKSELIAEAYENASKKDPQNEELLTHLFMAYVRLGEYKKQQQTAMLLYKLKPKNPYYFWAVMSIVMQAHSSDEKLAKSMFLPLAQKMTEKIVNDGKIEAEAEVELYLMILRLQDKHEEALKVLDGPLAEFLKSCVAVPQRRASLLEKLERWPEANVTYKNLLMEMPDNWIFYEGYFKSLFKIIEQNQKPDALSVQCVTDNGISQALTFVSEQINREDSERLRGPLLARLEFLKQLNIHESIAGEKSGLPDTFAQLMIHFLKKFGKKMCCFSDLKPYVDYSSDVDRNEFLELLEQMFEGDERSKRVFPTNAKDMQKHISYVQLTRYLGKHRRLSAGEKRDTIEDLKKRYKQSLSYDTDLLPTDVHPGDVYCVLAAHVMVDLFVQCDDDRMLIEAIMFLEWGLRNSPHSYQMKLLLIKLYHRIGCVVPASTHYVTMDVKQIQQDTIGYIITRYLTSFCYYSVACTVYGNTLRFFTSNFRDTIDCLISSYKFGSFPKIYEFVKFRERLNNSEQYALITTERMILDLILETNCHEATEQVIHFMGIDPDKDNTCYESLEDNRDLNVMCCWESESKKISREKSYKEEICWLKLRQLMVKSLASAVILTKSIGHQTTSNNNRVLINGVKSGADNNMLAKLTHQLSEHIKTLDSSELHTDWSSYGPYVSRLFLYVKDDLPSIILESLKLILYLYDICDQGSIENGCEQYMKTELP
ncbi:NAA25 (predicted), partial [Pycnogonum litorale]